MSRSERRKKWIFLLFILFPVLAAGYYVSAGMEPGFLIYDWVDKMKTVVIQNPLENYWNSYSMYCIMAAFICYLFICLKVVSVKKHYMHGREFGTAKFVDAAVLNKQLADLSTDINDEKNIVLSWTKKWFGQKEYKIERM